MEYPGVKRVEADRYLTKDAADREARLSLQEGGTAEVAREADDDGYWLVVTSWSDGIDHGQSIMASGVELAD
jgi:hypothetical protein